jgi:hypothetical protein
MLSDVWLLHE